ncbi:unnamed protein product [Cylicocyclus nassatus]|uniref:Uncharacterized protein n=1 Tax=Cylicocyclus nassatus TaxID=53992 RepID=A0AA36GMZ7_CYLNA|nr:unnamed protein product [Cylicocyclus nassatus]
MKIILLLVALFCMATSVASRAHSVDVCVRRGRAGCMASCKWGVAGSSKKRMKGFCVWRQKCENSGRRRCRKSPVCVCRFPPYKIDK